MKYLCFSFCLLISVWAFPQKQFFTCICEDKDIEVLYEVDIGNSVRVIVTKNGEKSYYVNNILNDGIWKKGYLFYWLSEGPGGMNFLVFDFKTGTLIAQHHFFYGRASPEYSYMVMEKYNCILK